MFKFRKHQSSNSAILNLFTNKKLLLGLLAVAIGAILIPTLSFATEVLDAEGESLPEKVENAINDIVSDPAAPLAAPNEDMSNYLCFTPAGASAQFKFGKTPFGCDKEINTVYYSDDSGSSWKVLSLDELVTITGPVYIKSNNPEGFNINQNHYYQFSIDENNKINASGSVMSLIDNGEGTISSISNIHYCFTRLFDNCQGLLSSPDLPATTLSDYCYHGMFRNCKSLIKAPQLPALEVCSFSYSSMFRECSSLEEPPILPATKLHNSCYSTMFLGCIALKIAPELPAVSLCSNCYSHMFSDCDALVTAPYLPAESLVSSCYSGLFTGCDSLKEVSVGFTEWNEDQQCTFSWLSGVPNNVDGVFICPEALPTETRDTDHILSLWTVKHEKPLIANVEGYNDIYDGQEHGITIVPIDPPEPNIEYSKDGVSWSSDPIKEIDAGYCLVYYRLSATGYVTVKGTASIVIMPNTDITANFVDAPYTKKYGDKDPEVKISFSGFGSYTPEINKDYSISRDEGEDVLPGNGTYNVYFNWLNPNYAIDPISTTLTINKADNAKLVADNYSRYSNDPDPTKFSAHMEGLKYADTLEAADYKIEKLSSENADTFILRPSLEASGTSKFSNNYDLDFIDGILTIYEVSANPEFQYVVNADNCTYDGEEHEFKIVVISPKGLAKVEYSVDDGLSWQEDTFKFTEQGTQTVHYRINYTGYTEASGQADLTIAPAQLTIVPDACYKNLGEADPAFTAQVYGLAEGESLVPGVDYTLTRAQGEEPGVYDINCEINNAALDNYNVTTGTSKFIIISAGGNAENVEGSGASGAKTGDFNYLILFTIAIIALTSAGYVLYRRYRKN